ncbi:MAG: GntR family transcriptional regulator [bacterium]|nr:GntR family transcriptional regulator [bacterium]
MENVSMFKYLYNSILAQIKTGRYAYGALLPSAPALCRIYNVGIRTARDVMNALRADGYIRTEERRRATVVYREGSDGESRRKLLAEALARRDSIAEVYDALELLMPPLFLFCARQCGDEDFFSFVSLVKKADRLPGRESWRSSSAVFHALLKRSGNPLFNDLYASLELYSQVPAIEGYKHPFDAAKEECGERRFSWTMEPLLRRDYGEADARLRLMFRAVKLQVTGYVDTLSRVDPSLRPPQEGFLWNAAKGKVYLYAEIARDLTNGISLGRWQEGDFLPSSKELAARYGVSLYVVRQALMMLEGRGFIAIRNGSRPRVTLSAVGVDISRFSEPEQKRDIWVYLCALQLMTMLIPHVARLSAALFTEGQRRRMRESLNQPGAVVLKVVAGCVCEALPTEPLRVIFEEINGLLLWGNHLMYQPSSRDATAVIADKCGRALDALDGGDAGGFAALLAESFFFVLLRLREFIAAAGMPEVEKIKLPL